MTTRNEAQESYIVYTYVSGFRMYLSIMGGFSGGAYNYMWDLEIRSSRDFVTKEEAEGHGNAAVEQNQQAQGVYVAKKVTHYNGMVELK